MKRYLTVNLSAEQAVICEPIGNAPQDLNATARIVNNSRRLALESSLAMQNV